MKIHASLQTDFSYYLPWLQTRIKEGYFDKTADNKHINRYDISNPKEIFLHTKNPETIYKNRFLIEKMPITLICWVSMLDSFYEPNKKNREMDFTWIRACSTTFPTYVGYGPIFYNHDNTEESHVAHFNAICRFLGLRIKGIYLDFNINNRCQTNEKTKCRTLSQEERNAFISKVEQAALRYNLEIRIKPRIDDLPPDEIDMGEKDGCPEGCIYCPYISNRSIYKRKMMSHMEDSNMLFGKAIKGQKVIKIRPEINIDEEQMSLFPGMI